MCSALTYSVLQCPGVMPGFTGDWWKRLLSGLRLQGWNKPWPRYGLWTTDPVWWRPMQEISSYHSNRPTNTHTPTNRHDRLQYTVPQLSAQCNKWLTCNTVGHSTPKCNVELFLRHLTSCNPTLQRLKRARVSTAFQLSCRQTDRQRQKQNIVGGCKNASTSAAMDLQWV